MSRNILLGYSGSLVGVPPSPRPTACASGRTRLSAWLCAPCGRFLLHIRAGEGRRILRRWEVSEIGRKFYSPESFVAPFFVMICQRRFKNVRKRRLYFVVFRRSHVTFSSVSLLKKCVYDLLLLTHEFLAFFQPV